MKALNSNLIKILVTIILAAGLLYAYYNVLNTRFEGNASRKQMKETADEILSYPNSANRVECNSIVCVMPEGEGQQPVPDPSMSIQFVHDLQYDRYLVSKGEAKEIFEFDDEELHVYSKGISPLYVREKDVELKRVPGDRWYRYPCEDIYSLKWKNAQNEQISYGYLESQDYLMKIKYKGEEETETGVLRKYTAQIKNTLRKKDISEESDNEFRKVLSANGLHVTELRKNYPEVYRMLKEIYNQSTEEMQIWLDEEGKMVKIEKDYTFFYYLNVMKQNSEKIKDKVGKYNYPKVKCIQSYTYSPKCKNIELPKSFEEL